MPSWLLSAPSTSRSAPRRLLLLSAEDIGRFVHHQSASGATAPGLFTPSVYAATSALRSAALASMPIIVIDRSGVSTSSSAMPRVENIHARVESAVAARREERMSASFFASTDWKTDEMPDSATDRDGAERERADSAPAVSASLSAA